MLVCKPPGRKEYSVHAQFSQGSASLGQGSKRIVKKQGVRVCLEARKHGKFARPPKNTVVVLPPLAISSSELDLLMDRLEKSISMLAR